MDLHVLDSSDDACFVCANILSDYLKTTPQAKLGLATGGTPEAVYRSIIDHKVDFSQVRTFNLDEYIGLPENHPQSYRAYMEKHLFSKVSIATENTYFPIGGGYDLRIKTVGGIDIQLLGLGSNGHIAFNEPGSSFNSKTRRVKLAPQTIQDNSRFFEPGELQPVEAFTMGLATIMQAKQILLLVTGQHKAEILKRVFDGPVSEDCPASILHNHSNVKVIADKAAAEYLTACV